MVPRAALLAERLARGRPVVPRVVPAGASLEAAGVWSAVVTVSGGWQGVVTVELEESVAAHVRVPDPLVPPGLSEYSSGRSVLANCSPSVNAASMSRVERPRANISVARRSNSSLRPRT